MADELDLETGEKTAPDHGKGSGRKRIGRPPGSKDTATRLPPQLKPRVIEVIEALANNRQDRGDDELADALRHDENSMAGGIESLVRHVPGAKSPIMLILGVVEPVLAFGRIAGLLLRRIGMRRSRTPDNESQGFDDGSQE